MLAAEVPEPVISIKNGLDRPGQVAVTLPVQLADVVSGHVDAMDAAPDIDAAAAALPAADAGDGDAQFIVDSAEGHELLWYATQELIYLHRLIAGRRAPAGRRGGGSGRSRQVARFVAR